MISLSDEANAELDGRKAARLAQDGVMSSEEIQNAQVVLECGCGCLQPGSNIVCAGCGKDLS